MNLHMEKEKVAAIVPAFNEEKTIGKVIEALLAVPEIDEIIVVDDGSNDKTSQIAQKFKVKLIRLKENIGKGQALEIGSRATQAKILLFTDADLLKIKPSHFQKLLEPVLKNQVEMTVGSVDRSNFSKIFRWILLKVESPVAGMRVLKREFWEKIPEEYKKRYFVESALTYFAKKYKIKTKFFILDGVSHLIKEKKYGFVFGTKARAKMFAEIVLVNILLRLP